MATDQKARGSNPLSFAKATDKSLSLFLLSRSSLHSVQQASPVNPCGLTLLCVSLFRRFAPYDPLSFAKKRVSNYFAYPFLSPRIKGIRTGGKSNVSVNRCPPRRDSNACIAERIPLFVKQSSESVKRGFAVFAGGILRIACNARRYARESNVADRLK